MADHGTDEIWFMGTFMRRVLSSDDTDGAISIMETWLPPHCSPPLHVHTREDQTLYVLEGELRARLAQGDGDTEVVVEAGASIFLPRDVPHTFISGPDGARMREVNTPGGFEGFHVETGEAATEARLPDPAEPDVPRLAAAVSRYGGAFVGPPMMV